MAKPARIWRDDLADASGQATERSDRRDWIAVLPLGAHEQHGPHLPFETDTLIAQGLADRIADRAPEHLPITLMPVEPIGYSIEHMDTRGTRTLSYSDAIKRWLGIAKRLDAAGIRKFVMLNAHGGNSPLMTIVATEARVRLNMLAVATSWTRFAMPADFVTPDIKAYDIHGGMIETSMILALAPDRVDMAKAADFPSHQRELAAQMTHLRAYGPHAFGWKAADLNAQGVVGDATGATAERGHALLDSAVSGILELLEDVHRFDLARLT